MTELPRQNASAADPQGGPAGDAAAEELLERLRAATRGEYEVYGELGRGGMATVYLAHEIALDRKVAIKVMSPHMVYGPGMVERFKREARTAANLSHPNIIPVYAVREADGLLFFVMKLVEGTPLDAIMKEVGKLPLPMVEAILAQVAGAFGYAHRHGVVHRDIKPSNILIDDEGWAVVTDFGIAKVAESEGLTQSGVAVGTPTYMSPEQCSGGVITGASDQYSLGVVAYEMLAGRPPFLGGSMMALLYSHFNEPPPPLESLRPDCPEPIRASVMRMLAKEPEQRWPSLEDATVAMGARHLAHDDPTRSQLISLARTGLSHKVLSQVQTPRSPVPLNRRSGPTQPVVTAAGPAPRRYGVGLLLGGAALLGAAALLVTVLRNPANSPAATVGGEPNPPAAAPAAPPASPGLGVETAPRPAARNEPTQRPAEPALKTSQTAPPAAGGATGSRAADTPSQSPSETLKVEAAAPPPPPAPAPAPVPAPVPPPAATVAAPPPAPATVVDEKAGVSATILSYARALAAADLAQARRLYPGMPADQRQGLEELWKAGGSMTPRWAVSDIVVEGEVATARVVGVTAVRTPREGSSEVKVALRARLERRGAEWRLVSLVN